jgi:4-hydroxy-3-polyprenylbenzoate decarboxylase
VSDQVVVGTGRAPVSQLAVLTLSALRARGGETHLVMAAPDGQVAALADHTYSLSNQAARIASGSFRTCGMLVAPCDEQTLEAISLGLSRNLLERAADVTIKERRPLVLLVTEAPAPAVAGRFDGTTTKIIRVGGDARAAVEQALTGLLGPAPPPDASALTPSA